MFEDAPYNDSELVCSVREKAMALYADSLLRNSVFLTLNTVTMAGFGFIFWLLVAHLYRPEQVGIASTLISAMNFIAYVSLLGVNSTFIRFLPKSKTRNQQINTGLILVTLATIVVAGAFAVLTPLYFAPKLQVLHTDAAYSLVFVILCIANSVNLVTDSIFIAYRSTGFNLLIDGFIGSGSQIILPVLLVGLGAYGIYAAQGAAALIAMIASIFFLIRKFNYVPKPTIDTSVLKEIRRYSLFSYSSSLVGITPTVILPIIILDKLGAAAAGYYYLATMLANVLFTVAYSISESLFAEGAYDDARLLHLIKRSAKLMAIGLLPASILMGLVGPILIGIFGKEYGMHARDTIIILAASGPFVAVFALSNVVLSITKRLRSLVTINVIYSITMCGLALAWAHRGLSWIAGAWLVSHLLGAIVGFGIIGAQRLRKSNALVQKPA